MLDVGVISRKLPQEMCIYGPIRKGSAHLTLLLVMSGCYKVELSTLFEET